MTGGLCSHCVEQVLRSYENHRRVVAAAIKVDAGERERDGCRYKGGIVVVAIKGVETWLMQEMWLLRGRNSAIKGAATGEVVAAAGDVDVLGKVAGSKRF